MATEDEPEPFTQAQYAVIREMLSAEVDAARSRDRRLPPADGDGTSGEWC